MIQVYEKELNGKTKALNEDQEQDAMLFQIKEFCVDAKIKGTGIESKLLEEFTTRLKTKGIDRIILFTSRTDGTEGFYKKHGFVSLESMVMMGKDISR